MFTSPGEIAFSFGRIHIHFYGLIIALSILIGIGTCIFICKKYYKEIKYNVIFDISTIIILSAIIGARIYYCILGFDYYFNNPIEILKTWNGGMSIHGGIIGGLIGGIWYAKRHNLPILKLCDIFAFGLCIGQSIGRWGNFFNSEAFGLPCNNFLKLYIPIEKRPLAFMQYEYFHPTFLYESLLDLCIFFVLLFIINKKRPISGTIFFVYLILYSIVRIFIEYIRTDSVLNLWGIPIAQIVSIIIIALCILFLIAINKTQKRD